MNTARRKQCVQMGTGFLRNLVLGLAVWALLTGLQPGDLRAGLPAAGLFSCLLVFYCRPSHRLRLRSLPGFALFFLKQSLVTGLHVAGTALGPKSAIQPGWIALPSRLPPGPSRALYSNLISLLPGSLCGDLDARGIHHIHLLNATETPEEDLRKLERRVAGLFGVKQASGN